MTDDTRDTARTGKVPRVSVVVPCYNSAWCIEDTLRTIRAQDFTDFELLVIDDGSTDDIAAVLAPHLQADPRVRRIMQENRGLAGARNRGLAEASGDLVAFIDADDLWHPSFLAKAVQRLDAQPAAPFAFAYSFRFDDLNRYFGPSLWHRAPRHDLIGMATLNLVGNGSAAVFRRTLLKAVGGFDETMRDRGAHGAEDWKLCVQMSRLGQPTLIEESLIGYRIVPGGMSQGDPRRQMKAAELVIADLKPDMPEVPSRAWRNAKVVMNGWLLPIYLQRGLWRDAAGLMAESYVRNIGWIWSPALRRLHAMRIEAMLIGLRSRAARAPRRRISDLVDEDGRRPFANLTDIIRTPRITTTRSGGRRFRKAANR